MYTKEELLKRRAGLSAAKREMLSQHLRGNISEELAAPAPSIPPRPADQPVPLSAIQERFWFLQHLDPSSVSYVNTHLAQMTSPLDDTVLLAALRALVERHAILRTTYYTRDNQTFQQVEPAINAAAHVTIHDLTALPDREHAAEARRLLAQELARPLLPADGPPWAMMLIRLHPAEHILLVRMHHLIADGWSIDIVKRELLSLYHAFLTGQPSPLPALPIQYADYAYWQRQLQRDESARQARYWVEQLQGAPLVLELPADFARPAVQTYRERVQQLRLGAELTARLKQLGQQVHATPFMTLLTAFAVLLARLSHQNDLVLGTAVGGRTMPALEPLLGCFINTLPLRINLQGCASFYAALERIQALCIGLYANQEAPIEQIVSALQPRRDLSRSLLYQVMFQMQNYPGSELDLARLGQDNQASNESLPTATGQGLCDLTLMLYEGSEITGELFYDATLFTPASIARLLDQFTTLLASIVADPSQPLHRLTLLSDTAAQCMLVEWNNTAQPYPQDACIQTLFERQAAATPDAVALVCGEQQLTYARLEQRTSQLAAYLRARGAGPELRVGIFMERSPELLIGLLGVLRAGGAYVPLDPTFPPERLAFMIQDAGMPLILTQSTLRAQLQNLVQQHQSVASGVICLDDGSWEPDALGTSPCSTGANPHNLAYVIYTSGSTGRPKGVQIPHTAVVNFLATMACRPGCTAQDVLLSVTTYSFDIAALELFLPLSRGARVVLADHETSTDGARLAAELARSGATMMQATPATWRMLLAAGWPGDPRLAILCGGEALPRELADQLMRRCATLWNLYGPTETTIWSSIHAVTDTRAAIPIGQPIANTAIYLLDAQLQPVPIGVAGELYIGGVGLARGYLGQPALTAERFIPNPFAPTTDDRPPTTDSHDKVTRRQGDKVTESGEAITRSPLHPFTRSEQSVVSGQWSVVGERLYRTGDLARYLPTGAIEYLGRIDHQVKLRGYRIELGEIESVLDQHAAVREAVAVVQTDGSGEKRLIAYLVMHPGATPTIDELRHFLQAQVPAYMVPATFVFLEHLPLTPNGKVDRKALPAPTGVRPELAAVYVAPRTDLEKQLAAIWANILHVQQVGIHDNFFTLGGDSLLALHLVAQAQQAGVQIALRQIFTHQTIAELVALLATTPAQAEPAPIAGAEPAPLAGADEEALIYPPMPAVVFIPAYPNEAWKIMESYLEGPDILDPEIVRQSIGFVHEFHDSLRLRFVRDDLSGFYPHDLDSGWMLRFSGSHSYDLFLYIDLSDLAPEEQDIRIEEVAETQSSTFDLIDGPVIMLLYFRLGSGKIRLRLLIHHLIADGYSLPIVLQDIRTVYEQLRLAEPIHITKTESYRVWGERMHRHLISEQTRNELVFWKSLPWSRLVRLPQDYPEEMVTNASISLLLASLNEDETNELQKAPAFYNMEMIDILIATLVLVLARWSGLELILIALVSHGRDILEDVDVSRTFGVMNTSNRELLRVDPSLNLVDVLNSVKEQRRRMPGRGKLEQWISSMYWREIPEEWRLSRPHVQLNYEGRLRTNPEGNEDILRNILIPPRKGAGDVRYKQWMSLSCRAYIRDDTFVIRWAYSDLLYKQSTIEGLAQQYISTLQSIIRGCQKEK